MARFRAGGAPAAALEAAPGGLAGLPGAFNIRYPMLHVSARKRLRQRTGDRLLKRIAILLLPIVLAACGGGSSANMMPKTPAEEMPAASQPPPVTITVAGKTFESPRLDMTYMRDWYQNRATAFDGEEDTSIGWHARFLQDEVTLTSSITNPYDLRTCSHK